MPIKSYLAYPQRGRRDELAAALGRLDGCEVHPALNRDLLVLVTDTPDGAAEAALETALAALPALQGLGLVAGLADGEIEPGAAQPDAPSPSDAAPAPRPAEARP
jgi:hypothetical protein